MQYKNPYHKRKKNTHALEISCGNCKIPVAIYQKAGKGNLIKMLTPESLRLSQILKTWTDISSALTAGWS